MTVQAKRDVRIVAHGAVDLWTEAFGDPDAPCLLLIMAAYWQGISWPDGFCVRLAEAGLKVIRFDHRDTGESTVIDYSTAPYTLADMAGDVLAILDAHDVERAHVLGASMGGMIAQELALAAPERVRSLVSLMSTPLSSGYAGGAAPAGLQGPDEIAWQAFATVPGPGKTPSREEYVDGWTAFSRGVAGTATPFDEEASRQVHGASFDRARNATAVWNHLSATQATPDRLERLEQLDLPTLVIHGSEDHVIPVAHAHATAAAVHGAELVVIEGLGHQFDDGALALIESTLLDFFAAHA